MDQPIRKTTKAKLVSMINGSSVEVHFNPASLVYTVENTTKQTSGGPKRKQFAAQFSGKLAMDLQFDTTGTGQDVRVTTNKVANFMQSSADASRGDKGASAQAQPVLSFQWGSYEFKGTMESFKETIDFFSVDGVPLRSLVSIGLARQDKVFDNGGSMKGTTVDGPTGLSAGGPASVVPTPNNASASSVAMMGGDPSAARQLGTDNGLESLRFTGGASLQVNAGIQFNDAVGFSASASAGLSIGGGAGLSIGGGAGISAGASGGVSFGASAGVASSANLQISAGVGGGALFGGQASAGVAATAGAFAGLEVGRATVSTTSRLNPLRMLPATTSADVSTGVNASFNLGGAATSSTGFSANVGTMFNFNDRLVFDSDSD